MAYEFAGSGKPKFGRILAGAEICKLIKQVYFGQMEWVDCYLPIAEKFSALKSILKTGYPEKGDNEIIKELLCWTAQDIMDAFNDDQGMINAKACR